MFAALLLAALQGWTAGIDVAEATARARQFLTARAAQGRFNSGGAASLTLLHAEGDQRQPLYYVFNFSQGFVIVSGDDRAVGILANGDRPIDDMQSLPESMKYWLSLYARQLEFLHNNPGAQVMKAGPTRAGQTVLPLITANWSQNSPYWNECPAYGTDTCYTGCPATSLAMVFHYWKYPKQQTPAAPSYLLPQYGVVLPELPPTVFDWDNMIDNYVRGNYTPEQATAVAHLMRYIGQVEEMDYTISGSGAYLNDILRAVKFFEYDQNAQMLFKSDELGYQNYSDSQWATLIQNELTAGRPIVYCAYDNTTGSGHAFNVDGYDAADDTYHINWGWNGRGNGYFALNAFSYQDYTFGTAQQMVIGIQPPADYQAPRLQVYPNVIDMECYINQKATATFALKGTNIGNHVTLTLDDPDGVFDVETAVVNQAVAEGGVDITVTYAPKTVGTSLATITCACEDTEPVTITLNGTAPLEVHQPVMLPACPKRVTSTSFRADWTDSTPARNVASYTLEAMAKPSYSLLVEADFSDLPRMSPTDQASHASDYLPEGWTFSGSEFNLEGGCIMPRRNSLITTNELSFAGYDKVTIMVLGRSYGSWGDESELTISTSMGSETISFPFSVYDTRTVVLDCAEIEQIVFKAGYYPMIQDIKIYAGDATQAAMFRAEEYGDWVYRLVQGITPDKFFTVNDLKTGETFLYKVKAVYIDGTESEWSNVEMVTLTDDVNDWPTGDVNNDGLVNVTDVTALITVTLDGGDGVCPVCADLNNDGMLNITDITMLINIVLNADE